MNDRPRLRNAMVAALAITLLGSAACRPKVQVRHTPLHPDTNDAVTFTVNASDPQGIAEIKIKRNGSVVATCTGSDTCMFTDGPFPGADQGVISYGAVAKDTKGNMTEIGPYRFAVGSPWQNQIWIPIRTSQRSAADAVDVCFIMDGDYNGNVDDFLGDVEDKIFNEYLQTDEIRENESKYKFYYSQIPGSASNCAANYANLPHKAAGDHCNAFAVLHKANFRDCSTGRGFTAEGSDTQAFIHESGHAIFDLSDEYEGDTSYFMTNPHPNIFVDVAPNVNTGQQMCQAEVATGNLDPNQCNEFCNDPGDCNFGWWRHDTMTTVMSRGRNTDPWGRQPTRRVEHVHDKY